MGLQHSISSKIFHREGNGYLRVGACSMQGKRTEEEDAYSLCLNCFDNLDIDFSYFGVYDGHAGTATSKYLAQNFHKYLFPLLTKSEINKFSVEEAFLICDVYAQTQNEDKFQDSPSGSAALVAIGRRLPNQQIAFTILNAGDCRAMVLRPNGEFKQITIDHKPDLPVEKERIITSGGMVERGRVNGQISLSRGFGDGYLKQNPELPYHLQSMIVVPDIYEIILDKDECLLLSCDGIFENLSSESVNQFLQPLLYKENYKSSPPDLAFILGQLFDFNSQSQDNMSSICIMNSTGIDYHFPPTFCAGPIIDSTNEGFIDCYRDNLIRHGYPKENLEQIINIISSNGTRKEDYIGSYFRTMTQDPLDTDLLPSYPFEHPDRDIHCFLQYVVLSPTSFPLSPPPLPENTTRSINDIQLCDMQPSSDSDQQALDMISSYLNLHQISLPSSTTVSNNPMSTATDYTGACPIHHKVYEGTLTSEDIEGCSFDHINCQTWRKETPLHIAVRRRNFDMIQLLVQNPSLDINARDRIMWTPLSEAFFFKDIKIIEYLLNKGANIRVNLPLTSNPIAYAIFFGNLDLLSLLLQRGVDPNAPSSLTINGGYPLHQCVSHSLYARKNLGFGVDPIDTPDDGITMIDLLLNHGADINIQTNENFQTPLLFSIVFECPKMAMWFLEHDARVDLVDSKKRNALHLVSQIEHDMGNQKPFFYELVQKLVTHSELLHQTDLTGNTPLHNSSQGYGVYTSMPNHSLCSFFISHGANPNVQNSAGDTPLHLAISNHGPVSDLFTHTDVTLTNSKGFNILHQAIFYGHFQIITLLKGHPDLPKLLNTKSLDDRSPFHILMNGSKNKNIFIELFNMGCDLHAIDKDLNTPLHLAVKNGEINMVKKMFDIWWKSRC